MGKWVNQVDQVKPIFAHILRQKKQILVSAHSQYTLCKNTANFTASKTVTELTKVEKERCCTNE